MYLDGKMRPFDTIPRIVGGGINNLQIVSFSSFEISTLSFIH
jgi:hypothetical protein